ncbi:MAG: FAD-dependent oxidoreductase [Actinomycetota bacterium]|nr:FAD-dependent oxidoreductase [Actinomycetota bacterium]MDP9167663.1 FAD-dependent oxidoreductase [Actinomycetota bacterium]
MTEHADVVVVGAGLMGAATAWAATRRGLSVTVVEQFGVGHRHGSSHGSARIVRRAYGDSLYTELSGHAFELWHELERELGAPVLRMLGGIDFGRCRDTTAIADHLARAGAEHEVLDAAAAQHRWPGMRFDGPVVYHRQAGALDADAAVAGFRDLASGRGAVVRTGRVTAVDESAVDVAVELESGERLRAAHVVVAAGPWVGPLLAGVLPLPPLTVTQQQVFHFPRIDVTAPPWPSVIHDDGHGVYHLAGGRDGGPGDDRKIGEHDQGKTVTPASRDGAVDPRSRLRVVEYVRRWLPGLDPHPRSETTCLYTTTPSEDFVLDRVGRVVVCSPCSGHGAKFAPLIGELVIDVIAGKQPPARFRLSSHARAGVGRVSL